jgi:hypothetical protein
MSTMAKLEVDFSNLPSDVALILSEQRHTRDLVNDLARSARLSDVNRDLLHQEIVGAVASVVDGYLP